MKRDRRVPRVLSTADLARLLDVSPARGAQLARRLEPIAVTVSGRLLYRAEDVEALVEVVRERRERNITGRTVEVANS